MKIRAGYDIAFECAQNVPMVLLLSVHPSREKDLLTPQRIELRPGVSGESRALIHSATSGRACSRPRDVLKSARTSWSATSGLPDEVAPGARQWAVHDLPDDVLPFLYGSGYCDTQKLSDLAWSLFGPVSAAGERVQAICDYVHNRIQFGYHHARCDRTASEGHVEQGRCLPRLCASGRSRCAAA